MVSRRAMAGRPSAPSYITFTLCLNYNFGGGGGVRGCGGSLTCGSLIWIGLRRGAVLRCTTTVRRCTTTLGRGGWCGGGGGNLTCINEAAAGSLTDAPAYTDMPVINSTAIIILISFMIVCLIC